MRGAMNGRDQADRVRQFVCMMGREILELPKGLLADRLRQHCGIEVTDSEAHVLVERVLLGGEHASVR